MFPISLKQSSCVGNCYFQSVVTFEIYKRLKFYRHFRKVTSYYGNFTWCRLRSIFYQYNNKKCINQLINKQNKITK